MSGMSAHQGNEMLSDEWLTPPEIIKDLGPFDLDPCSPIHRPWDTAKEHYTVNDNGLLQAWTGFVWCNPPYGKYTARWLERMAMHGNGIALIFARTETDMFFKFVWDHATSILFIRGRLFFHRVNGERSKANSGAPSVLIAYGKKADMKIRISQIDGKYMKL
jgi:hypothetical protein